MSSDKISGYLLNPTHPDGGSKARIFELFGFSATAPEILAEALLAHAASAYLGRDGLTPLGDIKLIYEGPLHAPSGRSPIVRTVWRLLPDDTAHFVTAVPLKERR
ncbi:hypothetical protein C0214_13225 [Methylobacterium sp. DM1]|nr:hypothetical protein C0214_13225 [Methylobacterium sp. DM1]